MVGKLIFIGGDVGVGGVRAQVGQLAHELEHVALLLRGLFLDYFDLVLPGFELLLEEGDLDLVADSLHDLALHQFHGNFLELYYLLDFERCIFRALVGRRK